jgi:hypothetical protein
MKKSRLKAIELMLIELCKEKNIDVEVLYSTVNPTIKPPPPPPEVGDGD